MRCEVCGRSISGRRADAKTCSAKCRKRLYLRRRRASTVVPLRPADGAEPAGPLSREELVDIIAEEARNRRAWAVRLAVEMLDAEPRPAIPARFLRALGDG